MAVAARQTQGRRRSPCQYDQATTARTVMTASRGAVKTSRRLAVPPMLLITKASRHVSQAQPHGDTAASSRSGPSRLERVEGVEGVAAGSVGVSRRTTPGVELRGSRVTTSVPTSLRSKLCPPTRLERMFTEHMFVSESAAVNYSGAPIRSSARHAATA
jgi:hypothetical protein